MHICYVADARSPIAKNWISHFVARNHEVTVISSYPCKSNEIPGARIIEFPVAFSSLSRLRRSGHATNSQWQPSKPSLSRLDTGKLLAVSNQIRTWIAPLQIERKRVPLSAIMHDLRPDIVHAMRLPFEGFLAAAAVDETPLLISVWGNDFTLFANRSRRLSKITDTALLRADGLHCDCRRDIELAFARGFSRIKPCRVLPGGGGIQIARYQELQVNRELLCRYKIPADVPLVINPRGVRVYVHNDSFFRSIPAVLKQVPNAFFIAVGMSGNSVAERWIRQSAVGNSVRLLPTVSREELAILFTASAVSVSPSSHDGTPNTLLESMACGCFPVAGELESVREWISDGDNGLLCDPRDASALARSIVRALRDSDLRARAAARNRMLIGNRADYLNVMCEAQALYEEVVRSKLKREPAALAANGRVCSPLRMVTL